MLFENRRRVYRARALRQDMTDGEQILWSRLRRGATGYWFRRQFPVGLYVLDFYCAKARLCVEVDGPQHESDRDARRDSALARLGIVTVRARSIDVFDNVDGVLDEIVRACQGRTGWKPPGA